MIEASPWVIELLAVLRPMLKSWPPVLPAGGEIDAAQERGEVARPNQPVSQYVHGADIPATFEDLGLSRQRAYRERKRAAKNGPRPGAVVSEPG